MATILGSSGWQVALTGAICGLATLTAAGYLLASRPGRRRDGIWQMESGPAFQRRMRRRRMGAALLAVVSIAFFVGVHVLEPARWPAGYLLYWLVVLILLTWLMGMGLVDLLQTRRMFRRDGHGDGAGKS